MPLPAQYYAQQSSSSSSSPTPQQNYGQHGSSSSSSYPTPHHHSSRAVHATMALATPPVSSHHTASSSSYPSSSSTYPHHAQQQPPLPAFLHRPHHQQQQQQRPQHVLHPVHGGHHHHNHHHHHHHHHPLHAASLTGTVSTYNSCKEEEKKQLKRALNRQSAQRCRKRKRVMLDELKEANKLFSAHAAILESLSSTNIEFNYRTGYITFAHGTSALLGWDPALLYEKSMYDLLLPSSKARVQRLLVQLIDDWETTTNEAGSSNQGTGSDGSDNCLLAMTVALAVSNAVGKNALAAAGVRGQRQVSPASSSSGGTGPSGPATSSSDEGSSGTSSDGGEGRKLSSAEGSSGETSPNSHSPAHVMMDHDETDSQGEQRKVSISSGLDTLAAVTSSMVELAAGAPASDDGAASSTDSRKANVDEEELPPLKKGSSSKHAKAAAAATPSEKKKGGNSSSGSSSKPPPAPLSHTPKKRAVSKNPLSGASGIGLGGKSTVTVPTAGGKMLTRDVWQLAQVPSTFGGGDGGEDSSELSGSSSGGGEPSGSQTFTSREPGSSTNSNISQFLPMGHPCSNEFTYQIFNLEFVAQDGQVVLGDVNGVITLDSQGAAETSRNMHGAEPECVWSIRFHTGKASSSSSSGKKGGSSSKRLSRQQHIKVEGGDGAAGVGGGEGGSAGTATMTPSLTSSSGGSSSSSSPDDSSSDWNRTQSTGSSSDEQQAVPRTGATHHGSARMPIATFSHSSGGGEDWSKSSEGSMEE